METKGRPINYAKNDGGVIRVKKNNGTQTKFRERAEVKIVKKQQHTK